MHRVVMTEEFEKRTRKMCSFEELRKLRNFRVRLEQNAYLGDAVGPSWLREMRLDGKRLYFLVDEPVVLFVACSFKNDQQRVIDETRRNLVIWSAVLQELKAV